MARQKGGAFSSAPSFPFTSSTAPLPSSTRRPRELASSSHSHSSVHYQLLNTYEHEDEHTLERANELEQQFAQDPQGAMGAEDEAVGIAPAHSDEIDTTVNRRESVVKKQDVEIIENVASRRSSNHRADAAAELLARTNLATTNGRIVYNTTDNRRVLRKIDLVILPLMLTVYFLQSLDKSTLSYASVFGLIDDTGLVGDQYSWLGSIVYLAQLVMQPIVTIALVRLPIGKFSATMVLLWGTTLASMAAAHNFTTLMVARFFLGAFEAAIAPAFVAITQMWWRRREQTIRVSSWYSMNGVTFMFGSLITWGLGHIATSSLHSYQIIFLFFGIITIVFSFLMYVLMPDSPIEAKFLSDDDKLIAIERLRMNQMGIMSREWRWDHAKEAFLDLKTWCWFALIFSISVPSGGISTFGPLIIQSFEFDKFQTILLNIPFGFVQFVAVLAGGAAAMKLKLKGPIIVALCVPAIVGCIILLVLPHEASHRVPLLIGYYILSVYPGISPIIYAWSAQNTAGDTKRKCVNGILFVGQSVGNVIGPQLYTTAEAPEYKRGLTSNLALYVVIIVLCGVTTAYLAVQNKRHANRRVEMGKSAVVYDASLDTAEQVEQLRAEQASGEAGAQEQGGDRAFDNLTDLENEDFLYVY